MRTLIVALALIFAAPPALAQTDAAAGFRIRGRGRLLALTQKGKSYRLNLGDQISAARLEDVELLFAARAGAFTYLVVAACGCRNLQGRTRGKCGAAAWVRLFGFRSTRPARRDARRAYESAGDAGHSADGYKNQRRQVELDTKTSRKVSRA